MARAFTLPRGQRRHSAAGRGVVRKLREPDDGDEATRGVSVKRRGPATRRSGGVPEWLCAAAGGRCRPVESVAAQQSPPLSPPRWPPTLTRTPTSAVYSNRSSTRAERQEAVSSRLVSSLLLSPPLVSSRLVWSLSAVACERRLEFGFGFGLGFGLGSGEERRGSENERRGCAHTLLPRTEQVPRRQCHPPRD